MRRSAITLAAILLLAGCGSSSPARPSALARCEAGAQSWARHFEANLPTPGTQAQVDALARPLLALCKKEHP